LFFVFNIPQAKTWMTMHSFQTSYAFFKKLK
jgi:hypothetical protein